MASCGWYKFNDFQTDGAESIAIHYFDNKSPIVIASMSQTFTQKIKDKFRNESPLLVTKKKGDWDLSGYIKNYETTFLAVQQDQPARSRLTVSVHVVFQNDLDNEKSFEKAFSQFVDFDSNADLSSIENELIEEVCEKIVLDIYNATINNW